MSAKSEPAGGPPQLGQFNEVGVRLYGRAIAFVDGFAVGFVVGTAIGLWVFWMILGRPTI
jgi:hypothetical protein